MQHTFHLLFLHLTLFVHRRIKCDEAKPACNNCLKTHRVCEGYRPRFEFRDGLNAKFRAATPNNGNGGSLTVPSTILPPPPPPPPMSQHPSGSAGSSYSYNFPQQQLSPFQYPSHNHIQQFPFQYPPQPPNYQYPLHQQYVPPHHHKSSSVSTISLPPIHTLNFHDEVSNNTSNSSGDSLESSPISPGNIHYTGMSAPKMTLPRIEDCLMDHGNHINSKELPPIHTSLSLSNHSKGHTNTPTSASSASSASPTSASSTRSARSASLVSSPGHMSDPRTGFLSGILNSPSSPHNYVATSTPCGPAQGYSYNAYSHSSFPNGAGPVYSPPTGVQPVAPSQPSYKYNHHHHHHHSMSSHPNAPVNSYNGYYDSNQTHGTYH